MNNIQKCTELLALVARSMQELKNQVVFVGGITTFAYLDSPTALEVRPTEDVDCTIEITSILAYQELETKLKTLGFRNDTSKNAPICRWTIHEVKVDVMPTEEKILGFTNRWYPKGIEHKVKFTLPSKDDVFLFSLPYFLVSKLEAYHSRGQGDPRTSTDIEDILLVLDGAKEALNFIRQSSQEIQIFIANSFSQLYQSNLFDETIEGMFSHQGIERVRKVGGLAQSLIRMD